MALFDMCGTSVPFVPGPPARTKARFVPIRNIDDVDLMSQEVAACIAPGGEDLGHHLSELYDLSAYVLGELGANVRQHSRGAGFVAAQTTVSDGFIRLAVADNGIGILGSFREAGFNWAQKTTDLDAMKRAIEPRVSSRGSPFNEGVGLTLVTNLAKLAKAHLLLLSGNGMLRFDTMGKVAEEQSTGRSRFEGTLVAMTFSSHNLLQFPRLLDQAKRNAGLLANPSVRGTFKPTR